MMRPSRTQYHGISQRRGCLSLQYGANKQKGKVLVQEHVPKVKVSIHHPCIHLSAHTVYYTSQYKLIHPGQ